MKALAIESAISCISIAAKNNEKEATLSLDVGMHQSEKLLPTIDFLLKETDLTVRDLEYIALSIGPGSFTGLRLGFSAAKAIQLATNCPIYGIPTLDAYAYPYKNWDGKVLSVIDAKKERFFVRIFKNGLPQSEALDISPANLLKELTKEDKILIVGADSKNLFEKLTLLDPNFQSTIFMGTPLSTTSSLFEMAEYSKTNNINILKDYDGPIYLRKSEAEENLNK